VTIVIAHELKLQNVLIQKDLQPDLPLISGDSQLLQQVVFNFISNAKWAIQKKSAKVGGTITIKTQHEAGKKEVCISVSDSGAGISKENLKKIFESFFSTKEVGEGTGLGLTLAQDIVAKHGGSIEVESQLGEGAIFKVYFPVISEVK
jgi:signal transduction histidine kinase